MPEHNNIEAVAIIAIANVTDENGIVFSREVLEKFAKEHDNAWLDGDRLMMRISLAESVEKEKLNVYGDLLWLRYLKTNERW